MNILFHSIFFSAATFISRILGLVRDVLFAKYFGASSILDAYFIAIMFPFFLRKVFGEGAMSSAFVPLYSEITEKEERDKFLSSVINGFSLIILLILLIVFIYPNSVVILFGSGAPIETKTLAKKLAKITAPSIYFIFLWAISYSIYNTKQKFFLPALTPAIANISIIFGILLSNKFGIYGPSFGFLLGNILMFISLSKKIFQHKYYFTLSYFPSFLKLFTPAFAAMTVSQFNTIVDMNVVSYFGKGGISYLQYASRFYLLPYGLFAVSVSTVILSKISNNREKYLEHLKEALISTMLLTIPSSLGLIFLSKPVIKFFYEHGEFSSNDTRITAIVLIGYVIGLPFYALYSTISRSFHAMKNMKTPFYATLIVSISNIVLDILLGLKYGPLGVALATSISGIIAFGYLLTKIKTFPIIDTLKIIFASFVMVLSIKYTNFSESEFWFFFQILIAIVVYFAVIFFFYRKSIWRFFIDRR
ncbi:MAG: putative peptidoglycan lipid flippase [Thermosipho sp. (in: thermotogales)]|nr:putative peptidoglycan lipid flippase [Thermosipho sp. (in: thermotogales)]MDN5325133.1 putative peptidoglycan lipid flippase [Thermosipho sp. (in: thermotogales)]